MFGWAESLEVGRDLRKTNAEVFGWNAGRD
jgi:hypothetical protein